MRDDRPPHPSPAATPSPQGEGFTGGGGGQGSGRPTGNGGPGDPAPTGGGIDLRKVPFAGWLEEVLPELCRMDVRCIGIVALCKNGDTATNYWNAVGNDVALMAYQMTEDALLATLRSNKNLLRRILEEDAGTGDPSPTEDGDDGEEVNENGA